MEGLPCGIVVVRTKAGGPLVGMGRDGVKLGLVVCVWWAAGYPELRLSRLPYGAPQPPRP